LSHEPDGEKLVIVTKGFVWPCKSVIGGPPAFQNKAMGCKMNKREVRPEE